MQIIDTCAIRYPDNEKLIRYDNDENMYEECDIMLQMINSNFWQVFSKDRDIILKLAAKFKKLSF